MDVRCSKVCQILKFVDRGVLAGQQLQTALGLSLIRVDGRRSEPVGAEVFANFMRICSVIV